MSILTMRVKLITVLQLIVMEIVCESDVGSVVNCAACQYLDGPWNSWECRVQCNVSPQGVQIMGRYWVVPGINGGVGHSTM